MQRPNTNHTLLVREKKIGNAQGRRYAYVFIRIFPGSWNLLLSRRLLMQCDLSGIKIIRRQMRYNRNLEIYKKVILFLLAFKYHNISLACQKLGYQRSYFYFWFNRLKQANFDIRSLEEHSRKPLSHPRKTSPEIEDKIIFLWKQTNYGPGRLQYHLEQLYNIHLPKSTIGHILKRENAYALIRA